MKSFFRWVVKNPLIANLLSAFFLLGGTGAYITMPQEYLPPVNLKWLFVVLSYPGVSASDIERLICQPTEKQLEKVEYVSQFNSISTEGSVEFSLQFEDISTEEFERQYQETRQAIDRTDLPDDILDPFFLKIKSSNFIPLVQVVVSGDEYTSYQNLRKYGENLRDKLEDFAEVDRIFLFDNRERQIHLQVNPILAKQIGVTLEDIQRRILVENSDIPAGTLELGKNEVLVRSSGRFRSLDDIRNTVIVRDNEGNHVPLSQIATVIDTHAREETRSRLNGRKSIALGVTKKDVGSSLELLDGIDRLLDETASKLPDGMQIDLVNDTSIRVKNALVNLQTNAIAGGFLVVIVLWLFIGLRNSLLTAIGIPIAFCLAFIFLKINGASINENTLFGLVLVLGMVVDDAIVVIENVYRYVQMGWSRSDAVIQGTREVLSPVVTSTLTTIAAFMPLVLLPGTIGEFLKVVPITVSLTLLASLIECFVILPSHIADFGGSAKQKIPLSKNISKLTQSYEKLIKQFLPGWRRYAIAIGIPFSIVVASAIIFPNLRQSLFSSDPQSYFAIWLKLPEGTSLAETDRQTRLLEEIIHQMPIEDSKEIERILVNVGVQNTESRTFSRPNYAEIIVDVADGMDIKSRLEKMVTYSRRKAAALGYTQEEVQVKIIENGPPKDYPLEAKIQGEDFDQLEKIAQLLKSYLEDKPGLLNVGDDYISGKGEITFTPLHGEAQRQGVSASDIGRVLRAALDGLPAGGYRKDDEQLPIIVRYPPDWFETSDDLGGISMRTPAGLFVQLNSVADLHRDTGLSEIKRRDFRRTITVYSEESEAGAAAKAAEDLQEYFRRVIAPDFPGYSLNFGGQFEVFNETFRDIVLLFGFGAMCIFFILVVQFKSLIQPLIILMTIPFALAGAMVGLVATGYPLSITAIYGMVGLSGVIVNDSIVLISFANNAKNNGLETTAAVIDAATKRIRPILLTTVTTVGGVLPIALGFTGKSEVWSPLATIIVFGLTTATALMLFVVPCLFCVADDTRTFIRKKLGWGHFEKRLRSD